MASDFLVIEDRKPLFFQVSDNHCLEVIGFQISPWWANLTAWARLVVDRSIHGTFPYENNPEPWPGFYQGLINSELSSLSAPWRWGGFID